MANLTADQAESLAERTHKEIQAEAIIGGDGAERRETDWGRVESDLAGLRLLYHIDRTDQWPYTDLLRLFSDGLIRTAAEYGIAE